MYERLFKSTESIGSVSSGEVPELGDLAQLARASALQAEGQGFKSPNLHRKKKVFEINEGRNNEKLKEGRTGTDERSGAKA